MIKTWQKISKKKTGHSSSQNIFNLYSIQQVNDIISMWSSTQPLEKSCLLTANFYVYLFILINLISIHWKLSGTCQKVTHCQEDWKWYFHFILWNMPVLNYWGCFSFLALKFFSHFHSRFLCCVWSIKIV